METKWSDFSEHMDKAYRKYKKEMDGDGNGHITVRTFKIPDTSWSLILKPNPKHTVPVVHFDRRTKYVCGLKFNGAMSFMIPFDVYISHIDENQAEWADSKQFHNINDWEYFSAFVTLGRIVNEYVNMRTSRFGNFAEFVQELKWVESLLVKLLVHPRRDNLFEAWQNCFRVGNNVRTHIPQPTRNLMEPLLKGVSMPKFENC